MKIVCPACSKRKFTVTARQVGKDLVCPCGVAFTLDRQMFNAAKKRRLLTVFGGMAVLLALGIGGAFLSGRFNFSQGKTVAAETPAVAPVLPVMPVVPVSVPAPVPKPAPKTEPAAPTPVPAPVPSRKTIESGMAKVNRLETLAASGGFEAPCGNAWSQPGAAGSPVKVEKKVPGGASFMAYNWKAGEADRVRGFTAAVRLQMVPNGRTDNNFTVWLDDNASGRQGGLLRIYPDRVEWGMQEHQALLTVDNTDGMHEYAAAALPSGGYAAWRDGVRLGGKLNGDVSVRKKSTMFGAYTMNESLSALVECVAIDSSGVKTPAAP